MSKDADGLVVEITRDEYDSLMLVLAYATSFAKREGDVGIFARAVSTANAINRNNPNWTPYEVPEG